MRVEKFSNETPLCAEKRKTSELKLAVASFVNGFGFLIAYNTIICLTDLWTMKFGKSIMFYLAVCLTAPLIIVLASFVLFGHGSKLRAGILFGYSLHLIAIAGLFLFTNHLWCVLFFATISGVGTGMVQGYYYNILANVPPRFMLQLQIGLSFSGFLASVLRVLSRIALGGDIIASSYLFYTLAVCFIILAMTLSVRWIFQNPVYALLLEENRAKDSKRELSENDGLIQRSNKTNVSSLVSQVWPWILAVFLNFSTTMVIFPGVLSNLQSSRPYLQHGWFPIIQILLFGASDVVIRSILTEKIMLTKFPILILSILRILFIPIFSYLSTSGYDFIIIFTTICFGLSSGYVGTIPMCKAPLSVTNPEMQQKIGSLSAFTLTFGLVFGFIVGTCLKNFII